MDAARLLHVRTLNSADTPAARTQRPVVGDQAFSSRLADTSLPVAATRSHAVAPALGDGVSSAVQPSGPSGGDAIQRFLSSARTDTGPSSMNGALTQARSDTYSLLMIQVQLARGRTSAISNILRVRHDTTKNSISNLR